MTATYLGTKGTRLPQQFLPNTFPAGAISPSGYIFLTSNGNSTREAGQIQLRRRLRSGFTATLQYTYAKAIDDAPLMGSGQVVTVTQGGASIAQNWLDLAGERGPSNFDQRHQMTPVEIGSATFAGEIKPVLRNRRDRKSTRLNSSHSQNSYAVFCLKKKKNIT